jgi:nucleoid-associated protein YgaU
MSGLTAMAGRARKATEETRRTVRRRENEQEGLMRTVPTGLDGLRLYLQMRIDRSNKRIALARKTGAGKPRGTARRQPAATPALAERRAYRDALRAVTSMQAGGSAPAALRLAAEEIERVKSALARIYAVTQHANHDIAEAGDWSIVEGEAQAALNVVHEAERNR